MVARLIAALLAIAMVVGAVTQLGAAPAAASGAAITALDDAPDLDPAVLPAPAWVALPVVATSVGAVTAPSRASGRLHSVSILRPPR
jgi:hypothetical protein